ncbi:hypothetical protein [Gluconacetobacter azotocaptans]|uniref:hypothetical protein n=1 Tax=Gluconacetobacter azotocaptans TaxID=142834 RepID=UPI001F04BFDE|nr:hypothetical protein [Gluconacetobacter azotocaptans]
MNTLTEQEKNDLEDDVHMLRELIYETDSDIALLEQAIKEKPDSIPDDNFLIQNARKNILVLERKKGIYFSQLRETLAKTGALGRRYGRSAPDDLDKAARKFDSET